VSLVLRESGEVNRALRCADDALSVLDMFEDGFAEKIREEISGWRNFSQK
jgi:hypothetical protein